MRSITPIKIPISLFASAARERVFSVLKGVVLETNIKANARLEMQPPQKRKIWSVLDYNQVEVTYLTDSNILY